MSNQGLANKGLLPDDGRFEVEFIVEFIKELQK
jgi:hypothetical protein